MIEIYVLSAYFIIWLCLTSCCPSEITNESVILFEVETLVIASVFKPKLPLLDAFVGSVEFIVFYAFFKFLNE